MKHHDEHNSAPIMYVAGDGHESSIPTKAKSLNVTREEMGTRLQRVHGRLLHEPRSGSESSSDPVIRPGGSSPTVVLNNLMKAVLSSDARRR